MNTRRIWSSAVAALAMLAALGCSGEITDPTAMDPDRPPPEALPFEAHEAGMQRLTVAQYGNSIIDVLGAGITVPTDLEPDTALNGFVSIGASRTTISPTGVNKYETAAYEIAEQALAPERRGALVPCTPTGVVDATCADMFVRTLGRRLFRRALTDAEAGRYVAVAGEAASTLGDFHVGLEFALAGLLQSPHFLFRVEIGEPTDDPEHRRYSNHEMASRLSYVLWNTTPDEVLLAAAERGELLDDTGLQTQVDRLLASDRSREAVRNFFDELFVLQRILDEVDVEKNGILFPNFDQSFRASAREETLALLDHHVFEVDGDYRELFTTHTTFLNAALAEHYDVALSGETPGFEQVSLPPENGRRGLLGHASILSIYAHDEKTSAAIRGRFVRQVLLCGNIPDPPPEVSTTFPPSDARTLRERVEQHLMNDGCANCHARMDPIGLALENFDAAGEWRDTENGATIDPSGVLDGVAFSDAADLGRAIAEHPNVSACLTRSMYRYATGHVETAREEIEILDLTESLQTEGHRVRALLGHVVMSRGFREAGEQL